MTAELGVCYYPEHWAQEEWQRDAARMASLGLSWVRIGEFAWSRIEPKPDAFDWAWLDEAIETLGAAGLKIVLGTPTATPPRWMLDKHSDMLAVDADGRPRKFGSRRHYCFSHDGYREESRRITAKLAERYGKNPHIAAWQTDNEYSCHNTTLSYSDAAKSAFQVWLNAKYQSIGRLNAAWGNVFWSMEYGDFTDIDLPNLTVTEPNPSHALAFRRFSSDQVVRFNRAQVDEIRKHSGAPILHNYMGRELDFDHFDVGADMEIASWDSYPLGFLEDRVPASPDDQRRFARQGDPDFQAFHHDLYRTVGHGRLWIMEQQPGPVNWAPVNPAPLTGMIRLWTWEAIAHGAEVVSYFRWRQAPFAQEQMHAGLLRPDGEDDHAIPEVQAVAKELSTTQLNSSAANDITLLFDYESAWAWSAQPQGAGFDYFNLVFSMYRACRSLGLNVELLPVAKADSVKTKLVLAPGLLTLSDDLKAAVNASNATWVFGPRSGTKTDELTIPNPLPPSLPGLDLTITQTESFRADTARALAGGGAIQHWLEHVTTNAQIAEVTEEGDAVLIKNGQVSYLAGWPDTDAMRRILCDLCDALQIATRDLPPQLRCRTTNSHVFWFNYGAEDITFEGRTLAAAGVLWEETR